MEKRNNIKVSVSGYFNCRKWKQGEEVKNMPLLSEDDAIKFVHVSKDPIADLEPSSVSALSDADGARHSPKLVFSKEHPSKGLAAINL